MELLFKKYKGLLIFMFGYWVICLGMLLANLSFLYVMLAWNILLASLPLLFINLALTRSKKGKRAGTIIFGLLWFVFFPNSVYMITDFIHISNDPFILLDDAARYASGNGTAYSNNLLLWIKLMVIGLGVVYGLLIGMESLGIFYRFIRRRVSKPAGCLILAGISLLSGFGVYIGRFLRFNSWDLLAPVTLVKEVIRTISPFALLFSCAFAGFILILFLLYDLFRNKAAD